MRMHDIIVLKGDEVMQSEPKNGDLVKFRHENKRLVGILIEVKDNPADLDWRNMHRRPPRRLARIMCGSDIYTTWLTHVKLCD